MKKTGRILSRVGIGVVIVALLTGAFGTYYLKSYIPNTVAEKSFPQVDGELKLAGLDGPVDIYRDGMGIPHIYATTTHDLFFAQGYIHAQDRFWQMDAWRHIGSGRVSEMFGEGQVKSDAFLRTLGWRQVAEQEYTNLDANTKSMLDAYASGVNAYIQDKEPVELSLEYLILTGVLNPDYKIEPWTGVNSLTWGKAMAWDLSGNMDTEIERAILLKKLSLEQVNELFPLYPSDFPLIVPAIGENVSVQKSDFSAQPYDYTEVSRMLEDVQSQFDGLDALLGPRGTGIGSNSWAISGELSATGMPLLANDPHLGIRIPSIWYQDSLHCLPKTDECPFDVAGFSFAGVPGVVIGHNDKIAWGLTNAGPDVQDLFIEKVNPDNPNQYEVDGQWVDFETRKESIKVGGGNPVEITVRISRHGPIISDTYGSVKDDVDLEANPEAIPFKDKAGIDLPEHYAIAMAWTALSPSSPFEAIWGFNRAQNWEEFREAGRSFHVPSQNLLYADVEGNIGYQMPGDIPIRKNGDGRIPVPGWTSEYDWTGFIPYEELPYSLNPQSGYIVAANNQINPWDYPYLLTTDWNYGFRANRIVDMIENAPGKIDIPYFQQVQGDSYNTNAETVIPLLLSIELDPESATVRDKFLASWDFRNRVDSQSAAVYETFWWNLVMDTFKDDLPEQYWPNGSGRWIEVTRKLVDQPNSPWWDDKDSEAATESRDDIFIRAFDETVIQMQKDYGKNIDKWPAWGDLHGATFENETLGQSGIGPIEAMFNRGPFPTGGGQDLVNATGWDVGKGFFVDWLPSMRMIVDMGDLRNSVTVHTTGNSGHAYHPHYIDMAPLWASVEYYPMLWDEQAVISNAEGHLHLTP
ncbi:MAG: penicillin acylase family protein [Anaerolineales bacterium]